MAPSESKPLPSLSRLSVRLIALLAVLGCLIFLPAGTLNWIEGWVFFAAYSIFLIVYLVQIRSKDPAQLQERSRTGANTKPWDKTILKVYSALLLILLVVSGLDAVRFKWAPVSPILEIVAWIALIFSGALILWVAVTNTFLSRTARIQSDRQQTVVSHGPYRFVRHPMYTGIILLFLSIPLALGSGWGFVPGIAIGLLFILRTFKEDQMLRQELDGYEDYARRVRFRLLPGIW